MPSLPIYYNIVKKNSPKLSLLTQGFFCRPEEVLQQLSPESSYQLISSQVEKNRAEPDIYKYCLTCDADVT